MCTFAVSCLRCAIWKGCADGRDTIQEMVDARLRQMQVAIEEATSVTIITVREVFGVDALTAVISYSSMMTFVIGVVTIWTLIL